MSGGTRPLADRNARGRWRGEKTGAVASLQFGRPVCYWITQRAGMRSILLKKSASAAGGRRGRSQTSVLRLPIRRGRAAASGSTSPFSGGSGRRRRGGTHLLLRWGLAGASDPARGCAWGGRTASRPSSADGVRRDTRRLWRCYGPDRARLRGSSGLPCERAGGYFRLADWCRRFNIDDYRVIEIDEIVGAVGVERRLARGRGPARRRVGEVDPPGRDRRCAAERGIIEHLQILDAVERPLYLCEGGRLRWDVQPVSQRSSRWGRHDRMATGLGGVRWPYWPDG